MLTLQGAWKFSLCDEYIQVCPFFSLRQPVSTHKGQWWLILYQELCIWAPYASITHSSLVRATYISLTNTLTACPTIVRYSFNKPQVSWLLLYTADPRLDNPETHGTRTCWPPPMGACCYTVGCSIIFIKCCLLWSGEGPVHASIPNGL